MKKILALAAFLFAINAAYADVCVSTDGDFDPVECAANGGTVGTPVGVSGAGPGGPGGPAPSSVPIDGGLTMLLASGAAMGVRRVWQKRKVA